MAARAKTAQRRRRAGAERKRLEEARAGRAPWRLWGPYLAERQWGTVREDYSARGDAWDYFPHEHARWRAYRWGEDGLLGFCDEQSRLCFSLALWNEADPILKERFFGVTNPQGNHGEDVKEYYFYLDATPTHSYMKALYKYPQREYPYADLLEESRSRDHDAPEYELLDTGAFDEDRYFDVTVEYAKASPTDVVVRISATNRGPDPAPLRLLPTLWFRNIWSQAPDAARPVMREGQANEGMRVLHAVHGGLGEYWLSCEGAPELLFTENETNERRLAGHGDGSPRAKDAINDAIVLGAEGATADAGTKAAAHYRLVVAPGATETIMLRLSSRRRKQPLSDAGNVIQRRIAEADAFYDGLAAPGMPEDARNVQRQAFAGLLWSKQFYYYDVDEWLCGDPAGPPPAEERASGRNAVWRHLNNADVISMPDKWEYPWYAAWDLAFHCIPLAVVDAEFAKGQLLLMLREWYMHPNGQLPAYEWAFGDVNPPVHAWAVWRVYKIEQRVSGRADRAFLERAFHKLLVNFTWWVNCKDSEGSNVFQGGFLGLDNIGIFDRNAQELPGGGHLEQADGTAWMGMYSLNMLAMALELARANRTYEDIATKFFEHFLYIANALNNIGETGISLWDEEDEFFYDVMHVTEDKRTERLKIRSLVGLIPLLAVETIEPALLKELPDFTERLEWFLEHRPHLAELVSRWQVEGEGERRLLALVRGHRMKRLLSRMLDEDEFLGHHGVRSLSRYHLDHPYMLDVDGMQHEVRYEPAESRSGLFGGNSNWRGPVWFPINFLLIESLQKFHHYYGDDFLVECPTGSGEKRTLWEIADELSRRLTHIFLRDDRGRRHAYGEVERFQSDPHWCDYVLFHEYFHGDSGAGLGASHQTGWTGLVAKLLDQTGGM